MNETRFPGVIHNTGPLYARDYLNNITVKFQIHGPPLRFGWTQEFHIKYLANALDEVSGGPGDVVGITIWAHFTSFPVNVYRERIKAVRAAIKRLLQRSPETLVVIKSANTNTGNMLYEGDWLAQRLDMIMRETFRGLNVVLVDAWEMTTAQHWHADNLHPDEDIIVQELDEGVIIIDYLQKGQTINGVYCAPELRHLRATITDKRGEKLRVDVLTMHLSTRHRGQWQQQTNVALKSYPTLPSHLT
ncbi:Neurexophilin [Branchiostoma belcheri]|nr:Neurexophilin [Branchiostoma belcheri]